MRALISSCLVVVALTGCKDREVRVDQYQSVPAPAVGQGVTLYLGDVELGRHAEVRVTAKNGDVLGHGDLEVGEELPFHYGGKPYVVTVARYEDHTLHEDVGFFRGAQRKWSPRADTVEIAEGATGTMPGRPAEQIAVGTIELDRPVTVTIRGGGLDRREDLRVGDKVRIESSGAEYSLVLTSVAFKADGADRAYFRMRPGRGR